MALPNKNIKGSLTLPSGAPPTRGKITTTLSRRGIANDGAENVLVGGGQTWDVPNGGDFDSSPITLVPNSLITPETYYIVTYSLVSATGRAKWTEYWNVVGTGAIDIADVPTIEPAISLPDYPFPVYTSGTRPTAAAAWAGKFIRIQDPGLQEELQFCWTLPGGGYKWETVSLGPVS